MEYKEPMFPIGTLVTVVGRPGTFVYLWPYWESEELYGTRESWVVVHNDSPGPCAISAMNDNIKEVEP